MKIWIFVRNGFLQEVNETNETNGTNESSFMDLVDPQMGSPIQAGSNTALSQRLCEGFMGHWCKAGFARLSPLL